MPTIDMSFMTNEWNSLREEARILGTSIESKLHAINKKYTPGLRGKTADAHLLRDKRQSFSQDVRDVEEFFSQLEEVNRKLEALVYKKAGGSCDQHVVRRYHDVLKDYTNEFHRIRDIVEKQMERDDLLNGGSSHSETEPFLNNRNRSNEYLLAEQDHIINSERLIDEQLSLAMAVKENINYQQRRLGGAMHQLQITLKKYPAINNIMQKIRMKKRKDTLVMAGVITTCLILMFLYAIR